MKTVRGKISKVHFGHIDHYIGISCTLNGDWGSVDVSKVFFAGYVEPSENNNWTEETRTKRYAEIMRYIDDLLTKAKKRSVNDLVGTPVEIVFNGCLMVSWKVLEEVL